MDAMSQLTIMVDEMVMDEARRNGMIEVAVRQSDAKFESFIKCRILDKQVDNVEEKSKLTSQAEGYLSKNALSMKQVRNEMNSIRKGTKVVTSKTKDMSIQIAKLSDVGSVLNTLSFLNIGLSMVNMGVDIAGFRIISKKLNGLSKELSSISTQLRSIHNIQKNEKISFCQKLIMKSNAMMSKISVGDSASRDELEKLLIEFRTFIGEMCLDLQDEALGEELVLNIIYTLVPAYTSLLLEFLEQYYLETGQLPFNYESFVNLYDELDNSDVNKKLEDYLFLEKKMHISDVFDLLNVKGLMGMNGKTLVEDQAYKLQTLQIPEKILKFDSLVDDVANEQILSFGR